MGRSRKTPQDPILQPTAKPRWHVPVLGLGVYVPGPLIDLDIFDEIPDRPPYEEPIVRPTPPKRPRRQLKLIQAPKPSSPS